MSADESSAAGATPASMAEEKSDVVKGMANERKSRQSTVGGDDGEGHLGDSSIKEYDDESKIPLELLERRAMVSMKAKACTEWDDNLNEYAFLPVCCSTQEQVDHLGIGLRLYFDWHFQLGIVFFIMGLCTLPLLATSSFGTLVTGEGMNVAFAQLSIANLGSCGVGNAQCSTREEMRARTSDVKFFSDTAEKVETLTRIFGFLDGAALLVFMAFGMWFGMYWMPTQVKKWDVATVTPSDYSLRVHHLPSRLGKSTKKIEDEAEKEAVEKDNFELHKQYESKLKEHFEKVLRENCGVDASEDVISEVTLVRDYKGAIGTRMQVGAKLVARKNVLCRIKQEEEAQDEKKLAKSKKELAKLNKSINTLWKSIERSEPAKPDEERDVCTAYIVFNEEIYKDLLLDKYRYADSGLFRCCLDEKLKFEGRNINVKEACEPTDIYWENMDVGRKNRFCRVLFTSFLTLITLIVCLILLVYVKQSAADISGASTPEAFWVIGSSNPGQCIRLCDLQLFQDTCPTTGAPSSGSVNSKITGFWDVNGYAASGSHPALASCPTSSLTGAWASSGCLATNTNPQWLGIQLSEAFSMQCGTFTQRVVTVSTGGVPVSTVNSEVQIYSCPPSAVTSLANTTSTFDPSAVCTAATALTPLTVANGNSNGFQTYPSGSMTITADATCAQTITVASAKAVMEEQIAHKLQDPNSGVTTYDDAKWAVSETDATVNCYCKQQEETVGISSFRTPPYSSEAQSLCSSWIEVQIKAIGLAVGSVVAVTILNQVLLFIFYYLCDFEKHGTRTALSKSQFQKLTIASFLNTGLLVLVINSNWYGQADDFPPVAWLQFGKGAYGDVSSNWYTGVGASLCLTVLIQIFSATGTQLVMSFLVNPLMIKISKRGLVIQQALNLVYVLPEWSLSCRMAQTMTTVAVGMMYSGSMPIMNFLLTGYCFVAYWADKWAILQGSRRPPLFRAKLVKEAVDAIPLVAFLHCFVTLWSFGNQDVFPSAWGWLQSFYGGLVGVSLEQYDEWTRTYYYASDDERNNQANNIRKNFLQARILDMSRGSCWLLLLIFLLFILYWVFDVFLLQFLLKPIVKPFRIALAGKCRRRINKDDDKGEAKSLADGMQEMMDAGLVPSYRPDANDRYKAFLSSAASLDEVNKANEEHEAAVAAAEEEKKAAAEKKDDVEAPAEVPAEATQFTI